MKLFCLLDVDLSESPCTCGDDEGKGRHRGRLGNLPPTGEPLPVRGLQLVAEASRASRVLGGRVLRPGAVAPDPDPPKV